MMAIDVCAYFGKWPYWPVRVTTKEDLIRILDKHGIEKIVMASTKAIFYDPGEGNQEIAKLTRTNPERIIGCAVVRPITEEDSAELKTCVRKYGMRVVKLFPGYHGYHLDEASDWRPVLEEAVKLKLPIMVPLRIAMNWSLPVLPASEVEKLADTFPEAKMIIGGVNYGESRDALNIMKRHENVYIETSCLQFLGAVERLVKEVGADRVLLGTGLVLQYPACGLTKVLNAQISQEDKNLIMRENAIKLLGL